MYLAPGLASNFFTPSLSYSLLLFAQSLGLKQLTMPTLPGIKPCPFRPTLKPIEVVKAQLKAQPKAQLTVKNMNKLVQLATGRELDDECSESLVCSPLGSWDEAPGDEADN